jgi:hypothetical protein
MEDATFKTDTETITVDKVKLVACDGMTFESSTVEINCDCRKIDERQHRNKDLMIK